MMDLFQMPHLTNLIGTVSQSDFIPILDVSDLAQSKLGTVKKVLVGSLGTGGGNSLPVQIHQVNNLEIVNVVHSMGMKPMHFSFSTNGIQSFGDPLVYGTSNIIFKFTPSFTGTIFLLGISV